MSAELHKLQAIRPARTRFGAEAVEERISQQRLGKARQQQLAHRSHYGQRGRLGYLIPICSGGKWIN